MKEITKYMIKNFRIMKLGYDFMGYKVDRKESLSFHHLVIAKKDCKDLGYGEGYYQWNGAILVQNTSHDYLHTIERIDRDVFLYITSRMIEENKLGRLDIGQLRLIRDALIYFEREHKCDRNSKGIPCIKEEYISKRLIL